MGKIQLTPVELLSQSTEMALLKGQYEDLFRGVEGILNDTNSNWSANLSNNFAAKIIAAQNGYKAILGMLQFGSEALNTSADSFQELEDVLTKMMAATDAAASLTAGEVLGASSGFFDVSEEKIEDSENLYDSVSEAAGLTAKILDDKEFGNVISSVNFLKAMTELFEKALDGEMDMKGYIDLLKDGWGLAGDMLKSEFLERLSVVAQALGLGYAEWEAVKDGDFSVFFEKVDDVISSAGSFGLAIGKAFGMVSEGFAGYVEGNKVLTAVKGFASLAMTFVGDVYEYSQDGKYSWQDFADSLMDSGAAGGAALVKGLTFGIIDIDSDGAMSKYKANSESFVNMLDDYGCSPIVQATAGVLASPVVFVGTTAEILLDTQPVKSIGKLATWAGNKILGVRDKILC